MHRSAAIAASVFLVVGCSAVAPSSTVPPATTVASSTPPASPARATVRPTPTPVPVAGCPTDATLSVRQYVDADPACFEDNDVTIRGWLDFPSPMGFEGPGIEPTWLAYPADGFSALWQAPPTGPDNVCDEGLEPDCAWFFPHINPRSSLSLDERRWVIVTGHVQDPLAETCRYVAPEDSTEELPPDAQAVSHCRAQFVVTSMRDAP
jgi:hypothetical protein